MATATAASLSHFFGTRIQNPIKYPGRIQARFGFGPFGPKKASPPPKKSTPKRQVDRPVWFPGATPPEWLDGTMVGDRGFDPFGLGKPAEYLQFDFDSLDQNLAKNVAGEIIGVRAETTELKPTPFQPYTEVFGLQRFRECELIHGRWAMLGVLGAIAVEALTGVAWQDAGKGIEPEQLGVFKRMLINQNAKDSLEGLAIIDAMHRLGIDYLFEEEIGATLEKYYMGFSSHVHVHDLHGVSLCFRLLRQDGYYVPTGVFNKFKDRNGEFKQNLSGNIQGLMSLYEASQLAIRGECALEEAADYSYQLLNSMVTHIDHQQARIVKNTLEHPHHKSLARFMAKNFFYDLQGGNQWINVLQDLAKFESKVVQYQHQQEILHISNWWKDLGLSKELHFARDQPMKWYMWAMACLADPKYSKQRIEITKAISFIYIIDDIFDVYGTLDELTVFTEVVNRWDTAAMEILPYSMKICFEALDKITNEISCNVFKDHGWNPVHCIRKAWASLCNAFLAEARWFASGDIPKAEEYLKNGIVSSGVHIVLVHIFFLLGQGITKENVQLIENNPGIISSTATILRLWDDLGSAKDEEQDGHDGSYVECYMKEHPGSSVKDARKQVMNIISEEWKRLNEECLSPNPFSQTFTKAAQNLARMVPLMYDYDDKHQLPSLEEHMKSLLYGSVSCCPSRNTLVVRV